MAASLYLDWLSRSLTSDASDAPANPRAGEAVLGYAVGYGVAEIAPFVRSLRAVFSGQIILVVDRKPELLAWLATHDVEAVVAADKLMHWTPHPVVARFAVYAQVLQGRSEIRQAVITDVRDVIFQSDPFRDATDALQFFIEAEGRPLADHAFNLKHLQALFGEGLARDLGRRACVCVGVVAGPAEAIIRFCHAVLLLCAIPRSSVGGAFGADQAACNVIAHLNLVGSEIRENYGRVATIGLTAPDRLRLEDGLILNPDGGASPIVHQYDRIPRLAAQVEARWGVPVADVRPRRRKTLPQRVQTLRASVLRRLPELR
ncbi:MAG: hypothetical protein EON87_02255 [Brevundimonas sp.]|nr:MAG: hypothetical protein EON87_02255 [Brevundimonas sp.]